jgi:formate dehydrogenase major subunit
MHLNGTTVHQVALPYHYGTSGVVRGDAANDLLSISGEPNVTIMEAKALTCNIVPGHLPHGPEFTEWLNKYSWQAGPPHLHPEQPPPGAPPYGKAAGGHSHESPTRQDAE